MNKSKLIEHYDLLIDENNDPVNDSLELKNYMNKWDGDRFIESLNLDETKIVLEIGVGTGRIALKVAPFVKKFVGIDISPKTIKRAKEHLFSDNVELICADFNKYLFNEKFNIIYSSLTFMHFSDKLLVLNKIKSLLAENGRLILSINKSLEKYIDMETRKLEIYPCSKEEMEQYLLDSKFTIIEQYEVEFAWIFIVK